MNTPEKSSANPGATAAAPAAPVMNGIEWNELITPDPGAALEFYGGLFGWTSEVFPIPGKPYTMLQHGGRNFGGVMAPPQPGIPAHWLHYVLVTSIEETLKKAESLGATVLLGAMDIGEAGRIAVLKDPQGAVFGLHQHPAAPGDAQAEKGTAGYTSEWAVRT
jgi:hypothetical protein